MLRTGRCKPSLHVYFLLSTAAPTRQASADEGLSVRRTRSADARSYASDALSKLETPRLRGAHAQWVMGAQPLGMLISTVVGMTILATMGVYRSTSTSSATSSETMRQ